MQLPGDTPRDASMDAVKAYKPFTSEQSEVVLCPSPPFDKGKQVS